MAPTAQECAQALLDIVPEVMQTIRRHVRNQRGSDLSVLQLRALAFLAQTPGAALSAVAEHVGLTLPSMSTQVSNLVERDLIARTTSPTDRRFVALHLTAQGELLLERVREHARASLMATVAPLADTEREQVMAALLLLQALLTDARSEPESTT